MMSLKRKVETLAPAVHKTELIVGQTYLKDDTVWICTYMTGNCTTVFGVVNLFTGCFVPENTMSHSGWWPCEIAGTYERTPV